jgi:hypothetical protein
MGASVRALVRCPSATDVVDLAGREARGDAAGARPSLEQRWLDTSGSAILSRQLEHANILLTPCLPLRARVLDAALRQYEQLGATPSAE